MDVLGIDVGGSGIKSAIVDTRTGELKTERRRVKTPKPATPEAVADAVAEAVGKLGWEGPIGCGFPAVIQHGVARTAANIDPAFIGTDVAALFSERAGCPTWALNDADAAGLAEVGFGAARERPGVVLLITIGTGLGSAVFTDGRLVPNTELGHLPLHGMVAEHYASDAAREREDLSWAKWARRFDEYLHLVCGLLWPDLVVLGGGAARKFEKYSEHFTVETPVVPAAALNDAGLAGAALFAAGQGR